MAWGKNSEYRHGRNGAKGDAGEALVQQYLEKSKLQWEHKNDPYSQVKLKIDFIVEGVAMDVKTNAFMEFLAVEIERVDRKTGDSMPGWLYTTTAEEIYGVDLDKKEIYRYNVEDMKAYLTIFFR
jgi:hypothetical protein